MQTPLSKREEEEIDQKAQQVAKTMETNMLKIKNIHFQQIDNLNEIGIVLNERVTPLINLKKKERSLPLLLIRSLTPSYMCKWRSCYFQLINLEYCKSI